MDYVQWNVPDWVAGTDELEPELEYIFFRLCLFIYLFDGLLKDDDRINARRCKVSTRAYRRFKAALIQADKIEVSDGLIRQGKCTRVLAYAQKQSEKQREKARKRWKKSGRNSGKKVNENNETPDAADDAADDANLITCKLDLEERKKEVVPGDAKAPPAKYRFEGKVIRLNDRDFELWSASFKHLELAAVLAARDAYLAGQDQATQKKWFITTGKYLSNENQKAVTRGQRPEMLSAI